MSANPSAADQSTSDGVSNSLRPPKSRRDRPCDWCRRLKHTCEIAVRDEPCANCKRGRRHCTFDQPASKRKRLSSGLSTVGTGNSPQAGRLADLSPGHDATFSADDIRGGTSTMIRPTQSFQAGHSSFEDTGQASEVTPETRPAAHLQPPRTAARGSLRLFMQALDQDHDTGPASASEQSRDYRSLDLDSNDFEESHYLGHRAFGQLVLDPISTNDGPSASPVDPNVPGQRLYYRQVASARDPAYFLRNPSMPYGLANTDFAAEKAYGAVIAILRQVQEDLPERLVQIFLNKSLPIIPVIDRFKLESACYARNGSGAFPHAIMTGVLAHAAVHVASLRHRVKELWSIVLHLLDNEYRHPRLQTLQMALMDIFGRPTLNPGGNHIAISRAIGTAQLLGLHRNCEKWKLPAWERQSRQRIWWCLYIADKWNAFCYGQPSNMPGPQLVPLPTKIGDKPTSAFAFDHDPSDGFIISCRLSVVIDSLLPLLGTHKYGVAADSSQMLIANASRDLDSLERYNKTEAGSASTTLSIISLSTVICRLSLEDTSTMSTNQLPLAFENAVLVAGELTEFLESLNVEDYGAFWSPWSPFQIIHGFSLLIYIVQTTHLHTSMRNALQSACSHLQRQVRAIQRGLEAAWEVAEVVLPRIKLLADSMPDIADMQVISQMMAPPPGLADPAPSSLRQDESFDFEQWLNTTDWMTGMGLWTDGSGDTDIFTAT